MDRLAELARTEDVTGVLLYADGSHSIARPSALEFFAGVSPLADRNALVVTAEGSRGVVVDLERDVDRVARHTGIEDVRGAADFDRELVDLLDDLGVDDAVGVAGRDRITRSTREAIATAVDRVEPIDAAVDALAAEKDEAVLDTFRELGRLADIGFQTAYEVLRPGIKEYELAAEIEHAMRIAGSEDNFNLLSSGSHNQLMHGPTERIVRKGDTVLFEISPVIDGLVVQICRTIVVGTPDRTLVEKFGLLTEAMNRTRRRIRPGAEAGVIAESMNAVFRDAGYDEYCRPPYMRTRGHEFGIGPIGMAIDEGTETELEPGMVLVIHPNQYVPETGYLSLGDPIEITDDGFETLVDTEARLFTKEVF